MTNYILDLRVAPNIEDIQPDYQFAHEDMDNFGFPRGTYSALLSDLEDKSHDFMESVFKNAGFHVRLFSDENSAKVWLEG